MMGLNVVLFVFFLPEIHGASLIYVLVFFSIWKSLGQLFLYPVSPLLLGLPLCMLKLSTVSCFISPLFFSQHCIISTHFFPSFYYSSVSNVLVSPTLKFSFLMYFLVVKFLDSDKIFHYFLFILSTLNQ